MHKKALLTKLISSNPLIQANTSVVDEASYPLIKGAQMLKISKCIPNTIRREQARKENKKTFELRVGYYFFNFM